MQIFLGPVPRSAVGPPINIGVAIGITVLAEAIAVVGKYRGRRPFLARSAATISVLVAFVCLMLIVGFTRQIPAEMAGGLSAWYHKVGLTALLESRAFLGLYAYLLLVLGTVTAYRLHSFKWVLKDIAFTLNHVGLYVFLLFALLSSSEMQRFTMTLFSESAQPEWRAVDGMTKQVVELPIALKLKRFDLKEYPPKLMILDLSSGDLMPKKRPEHLVVDSLTSRGQLLDWRIEILEYLPLSAPLVGATDIVFKDFHSTGGAASVRVRASRGAESFEGWVTTGSYLFPYRSLALSDSLAVVMPEREPKQFTSEVQYYTKAGEMGTYNIRVNHPLRLKSWYVYQLGYDREMGRWSKTSELELVYDRWMYWIYIGIGMMLLGALCLLFGPITHTKKA